MSYFDLHKDPFIDALDKAIIDAVRYKQFMTSKEIWVKVSKKQPGVSPSIIHQRANRLVRLGILGCLEQDHGDAVLRRFYCFQEDPDYFLNHNYVENGKN